MMPGAGAEEGLPPRDRVLASMLVSHLGDSAGARFEFGPPVAVPADPDEALALRAHAPWRAGEPTDDTDQAIMVAEAVCRLREGGTPLAATLCGLLSDWLAAGPKDCGVLTLRAISLMDRHGAAAGRVAWEESGRQSAGNGGIMRAHPAGLLAKSDGEAIAFARESSEPTHADPRCIAAAVFQALLARRAAMGGEPGEAIASAARQAAEAARNDEIIDWTAPGREGFTGYCLHAAACAAGAMRVASKEQAAAHLAWVVCQGDDADTNGCVAGAILGARFGLEPFAKHLAGLLAAGRIESLVERAFRAAG